jgi:hypothetical protein
VSKHRKTRSRVPLMWARQNVTTGVGGAAVVGVGLLLAAPPGAPAPATADVQLAFTDFALRPVDCAVLVCDASGGTGLNGSAPTPTALAVAALPPMIGPGGWLIGDGLDALEIDPDCLASIHGRLRDSTPSK